MLFRSNTLIMVLIHLNMPLNLGFPSAASIELVSMAEINYRKFYLLDKELCLAPISLVGKGEWLDLRARNREWLGRWEASRPNLPPEIGKGEELPNYRQMIAFNQQEAEALRNIALGIWMINSHPNCGKVGGPIKWRSEEHTSELQSH